MFLLCRLKSDFDAAVDHTTFSVRVNLSEGWHLVGWENHLGKSALSSVCDIFEIDKETVFAESLFAEDSQDPKRFGSETVTQKLTTRVIRLESGFIVPLFLKKQR